MLTNLSNDGDCLETQDRVLDGKKTKKTNKKKKRIQYSLQNYNQLRIVDKMVILERNLLYFCRL